MWCSAAPGGQMTRQPQTCLCTKWRCECDMLIRIKTLVRNKMSRKTARLNTHPPGHITTPWMRGESSSVKKKNWGEVCVFIFNLGFLQKIWEIFKGSLGSSQRYMRTITGRNVKQPFWKQQEGMINFTPRLRVLNSPPPYFVIFSTFSALMSPRLFLGHCSEAVFRKITLWRRYISRFHLFCSTSTTVCTAVIFWIVLNNSWNLCMYSQFSPVDVHCLPGLLCMTWILVRRTQYQLLPPRGTTLYQFLPVR